MVAAVGSVGWGGAVEGLFFHAEVGVEVDLGGAYVFVAEPEGDDGKVDAGLEESHGAGVTKRV